MMDRYGPSVVMQFGTASIAAGFLLAPLTTEPWHLYLTIGVLVGGGSVCLGYSGQSLFLPNWFARARGLAIGLAFSGVGLGSVTLLPWVQSMIAGTGWRDACRALGLVSLIGVAGQISLGHASDRIGREWICVISNLGCVICFLALIVLQHDPSMIWLYLMVAARGGLGYGLTSVMGAMVAEIFQGRHFGGIFGTVMLAAMAAAAARPWLTGVRALCRHWRSGRHRRGKSAWWREGFAPRSLRQAKQEERWYGGSGGNRAGADRRGA
jgi:MFS family permease